MSVCARVCVLWNETNIHIHGVVMNSPFRYICSPSPWRGTNKLCRWPIIFRAYKFGSSQIGFGTLIRGAGNNAVNHSQYTFTQSLMVSCSLSGNDKPWQITPMHQFTYEMPNKEMKNEFFVQNDDVKWSGQVRALCVLRHRSVECWVRVFGWYPNWMPIVWQQPSTHHGQRCRRISLGHCSAIHCYWPLLSVTTTSIRHTFCLRFGCTDAEFRSHTQQNHFAHIYDRCLFDAISTIYNFCQTQWAIGPMAVANNKSQSDRNWRECHLKSIHWRLDRRRNINK